jgi:hypothetical protein
MSKLNAVNFRLTISPYAKSETVGVIFVVEAGSRLVMWHQYLRYGAMSKCEECFGLKLSVIPSTCVCVISCQSKSITLMARITVSEGIVGLLTNKLIRRRAF